MLKNFTLPDPLKKIAKGFAWFIGYKPSHGNYGVERQPHLGGYWMGGDPNTYCPQLWDFVVKEYAIRSVLDVGCGQGYATKYFHELGIRALGIEGGRQALKTSPVPQLIVHHDYTKGPFKPPEPVDLVWCCEFVEHVEERFVPNFLATFKAARLCLLTHAFPGQEGYHHVNCKSAEYWIDRMKSIDFIHVPAATERLRALAGGGHVGRSLLFFASGKR